MGKYILQSVEGIHWFDVVPTVLFFIAFVVACGLAFLQKKGELDRIARLPLDD